MGARFPGHDLGEEEAVLRRSLPALLHVLTLVSLLCLPDLGWTRPKKGSSTVDRLAGKVILSPRPFPPSFPSDRAFLKAMKRMDTKVFRATKKGLWEIDFLAFFPVPMEELTCELHFFDRTYKESKGKSEHVETRTKFLSRRGERTLASSLRLEAPQYKKDHTYRLIVARRSDRALLAEATFLLRGPR